MAPRFPQQMRVKPPLSHYFPEQSAEALKRPLRAFQDDAWHDKKDLMQLRASSPLWVAVRTAERKYLEADHYSADEMAAIATYGEALQAFLNYAASFRVEPALIGVARTPSAVPRDWDIEKQIERIVSSNDV